MRRADEVAVLQAQVRELFRRLEAIEIAMGSAVTGSHREPVNTRIPGGTEFRHRHTPTSVGRHAEVRRLRVVTKAGA